MVALATLDGVRLKLIRAEQHLRAIEQVFNPYRYGSLHVVAQYHPDPSYRELILHLPSPGLEPSIIIGDCLHNMRSALDHMVWQLVIANHRSPHRSNMFPICIDVLDFADELRRKRLDGICDQARTIIEAVQPYHRGQRDRNLHPLWILHELTNIDKHRTLNLTSVVATTIELQAGGIKVSIAAGEIADGAVLLRDHISEKVDMHAEGSMFVAFKDAPARKRDVLMLLQEILDFIGQGILPGFEPFFN